MSIKQYYNREINRYLENEIMHDTKLEEIFTMEFQHPIVVQPKSNNKEKGFYYLATVYSKHESGDPWEAYKQAVTQAAVCLANNIPVFCPIAHTHGIGTDFLNHWKHEQWLELDDIFVRLSKGLIVTKMTNWEKSVGITHEIKLATELGLPIYYVDFLEVPKFEWLNP